MNRDDILGRRTDLERAKEYLHPRRAAEPRPKAPPQTEALFPEPEQQNRTLVPLDGWPDYRARSGDGDAT